MTVSSDNQLIIVAAGSGSRMGSELPKQFLLLDGRPILIHTLERFHRWDPNIRIVVVLHPEYMAFWDQLCRDHHLLVPHSTVAGGKERFHSVQIGLERLDAITGIVGIHDGVRPLVDHEVISRCYRKAAKVGAAIPVMPVTDSMRRRTNGEKPQVVDRSQYVRVQTPQCFQIEVVRRAYRQDFTPVFTDDASVVEAMGHAVEWVDGNEENIKITSPVDLRVAEFLMKG